MKKLFYTFLALNTCFATIILEPETQIQESIYYNPLDEDSYYKIGDINTSFSLYGLDRNKFVLALNYEWSSDYLITIINFKKSFIEAINKNQVKMRNFQRIKFK